MTNEIQEHSFVVGEKYTFTNILGRSEEGTLLYMYTMRVYDTDAKGNMNKKKWKVINFRCGYVPLDTTNGVYSVHLGCGRFKVTKCQT